jgi:hypothetical protein
VREPGRGVSMGKNNRSYNEQEHGEKRIFVGKNIVKK